MTYCDCEAEDIEVDVAEVDVDDALVEVEVIDASTELGHYEGRWY